MPLLFTPTLSHPLSSSSRGMRRLCGAMCGTSMVASPARNHFHTARPSCTSRLWKNMRACCASGCAGLALSGRGERSLFGFSLLTTWTICGSNAEQWIARSIESVLHQTVPATEILVIDDGSVDGTARVIHTYAPAVRHLFQENRRVSVALNRGIQQSTQEWIGILVGCPVFILRCCTGAPSRSSDSAPREKE